MFSLINKAPLIKLIIILFTIGFITYASSFTNQFVWDDNHFFYQNIFTQDLKHIQQIFTSNTTAGGGVSSNYYRPLTTLSFAIDHQIWGWNPIGLHFTNTFFHAINGAQLFLLLLLLKFNKSAAFIISLIFIIHPIQTEAVTYLSSRGDILYTFFLLASLHLFTISLYKKNYVFIFSKNKKITLSQNFLLFLSFALFPLSILSKEGALTTLPIYPSILFVFALQQKLTFTELHKKYRPHFIAILMIFWAAIFYFLLRLTFLNFGGSLNYSGDQSIYAKNIFIRLLTFLKTLIIYIKLLILPYPLYLERSTEIATSIINPWVLGTIGITCFTIYAGIIEIIKKKTGWIFFALIVIFANLASVSGIIPMTGLLRENWLYVPMIGFYIITFIFLQFLTNSFKEKITKQFYKIIQILLLIYFLILIGMTIQQNYNWRDSIAYFEHNLKFTNSARLHLNLGNSYIGKGDYKKALYHLNEALRFDNSAPQIYYNLANIYFIQKNYDLAEKELLNSLQVDPNYLYTYPILINLYETTNQRKKTLPYLERLTRIYPDDLKILLMYANNAWLSGEYELAEKNFNKAIKLSKNDQKLIQAIDETKKQTNLPIDKK